MLGLALSFQSAEVMFTFCFSNSFGEVNCDDEVCLTFESESGMFFFGLISHHRATFLNLKMMLCIDTIEFDDINSDVNYINVEARGLFECSELL